MLLRNNRSLAQIFRRDRDEEATKADGARRAMKSDDGCVWTYCPRSNSKLMQYPSGVRKPQQNRYEIGGLAFSLLEILIALSLLAMTLGGIFKLWPTSQRLIFEAEQKRNATLIAQRIIETLKVTSPNGIIALSSDWVDNPSHCIRVELSSPSEHVIAYDASGIPQCERSIAESLNSLREKNIVSVARITIGRALLPGLAPVFISVGSPAVLPDQQRHHTEFTSFLSMPPPRKESSGEGSS